MIKHVSVTNPSNLNVTKNYNKVFYVKVSQRYDSNFEKKKIVTYFVIKIAIKSRTEIFSSKNERKQHGTELSTHAIVLVCTSVHYTGSLCNPFTYIAPNCIRKRLRALH